MMEMIEEKDILMMEGAVVEMSKNLASRKAQQFNKNEVKV
jgi:hypothetical protein